jgi:hypothetical protein
MEISEAKASSISHLGRETPYSVGKLIEWKYLLQELSLFLVIDT